MNVPPGSAFLPRWLADRALAASLGALALASIPLSLALLWGLFQRG
jgi:hypothetical protein